MILNGLNPLVVHDQDKAYHRFANLFQLYLSLGRSSAAICNNKAYLCFPTFENQEVVAHLWMLQEGSGICARCHNDNKMSLGTIWIVRHSSSQSWSFLEWCKASPPQVGCLWEKCHHKLSTHKFPTYELPTSVAACTHVSLLLRACSELFLSLLHVAVVVPQIHDGIVRLDQSSLVGVQEQIMRLHLHRGYSSRCRVMMWWGDSQVHNQNSW